MFKIKKEKDILMFTFVCIFAYFIIMIIEKHEIEDIVAFLFILYVFFEYLYYRFIKKVWD